MAAVRKLPGDDVFGPVVIPAHDGNGAGHAPEPVGRRLVRCVPLGTEHHGRTLAALLIEGLRVGAAIDGAIIHLHLFAAADHHGVLGRHSRFSALVYSAFRSGGAATTVLQTIKTIAAGIGTMWGVSEIVPQPGGGGASPPSQLG